MANIQYSRLTQDYVPEGEVQTGLPSIVPCLPLIYRLTHSLAYELLTAKSHFQ